MMSYLKVLVALFLAVSITASAVQLDGYEITEKQEKTDSDGNVVKDENGDPVMETVVVNSMDSTDTSNFTTLDEYEKLIDNHIAVDRYDQSPYGVFAEAHGNRTAEPLHSILDEAIGRGIAEPADVFDWLIINVRQTVRARGAAASHSPEYFDMIPKTVQHMAAADVSNVDDISRLDVFWTANVAGAILNNVESDSARQAFDNIWTVAEKSYDTSTARYKGARARFYHMPLGQTQQAHDLLVQAAETGNELHIPLLVGKMSEELATDELLSTVIQKASDEFIINNQDMFISFWNSIDWAGLAMEKSPDELKSMVYKYKASVPRKAKEFKTEIVNKYRDVTP